MYTKTGDKGSSSLYNGERRRKDDLVFHALGDVDELNSAVGLAAEHCSAQQGLDSLCSQLATVQSRLLDVGSAVATPVSASSEAKVKRVQFDANSVDVLERWLDAMDDQLPQLTNFILPSGGLAAAHLHMARAVCRRAERAVVALASYSDESESGSSTIKGLESVNLNGTTSVDGPKACDAEGVTRTVIDPVVIKYLNRLSDYLFTAARFAALKANREETIYKKGVSQI